MEENPQVEILINPKDFSAEDISNLIQSAFATPIKMGVQFRPESLDKEIIEEYLADSRKHFICAKIGGKLAGATILFEQNLLFGNGKKIYVRVEAVSPEFKGMQIGNKLNEAALAYAHEAGSKYCFVSTSADSKWNLDRLVKLGFKKWKFKANPDRNYFSIIFRKDFPETKTKNFLHAANFAFSYLWTNLCYKKYAKHTIFGNVFARPLNKIKALILRLMKS